VFIALLTFKRWLVSINTEPLNPSKIREFGSEDLNNHLLSTKQI
jgi:hypothetical protein